MDIAVSRVTIVGADDSIPPEELFNITNEFPFVEFGINVAPGPPSPRFPSQRWLDLLAAACHRSTANKNIAVAGHISGPWVGEIFQGKWPYPGPGSDFSSIVSRWQLNTNGIGHQYNIKKLVKVLKYQNAVAGEIVFQHDGKNTAAIETCQAEGVRLSLLSRIPNSRGIQAPSPPPHLGGQNGYAGELSSANLESRLRALEPFNEGPVWLAVETHMRTDRDKQFSLTRVREFLTIAKAWIKEPS